MRCPASVAAAVVADDARTGAVAASQQLALPGKHLDRVTDDGGEAGSPQTGRLAGAAEDLVLSEGEGDAVGITISGRHSRLVDQPTADAVGGEVGPELLTDAVGGERAESLAGALVGLDLAVADLDFPALGVQGGELGG